MNSNFKQNPFPGEGAGLPPTDAGNNYSKIADWSGVSGVTITVDGDSSAAIYGNGYCGIAVTLFMTAKKGDGAGDDILLNPAELLDKKYIKLVDYEDGTEFEFLAAPPILDEVEGGFKKSDTLKPGGYYSFTPGEFISNSSINSQTSNSKKQSLTLYFYYKLDDNHSGDAKKKLGCIFLPPKGKPYLNYQAVGNSNAVPSNEVIIYGKKQFTYGDINDDVDVYHLEHLDSHEKGLNIYTYYINFKKTTLYRAVLLESKMKGINRENNVIYFHYKQFMTWASIMMFTDELVKKEDKKSSYFDMPDFDRNDGYLFRPKSFLYNEEQGLCLAAYNDWNNDIFSEYEEYYSVQADGVTDGVFYLYDTFGNECKMQAINVSHGSGPGTSQSCTLEFKVL